MFIADNGARIRNVLVNNLEGVIDYSGEKNEKWKMHYTWKRKTRIGHLALGLTSGVTLNGPVGLSETYLSSIKQG